MLAYSSAILIIQNNSIQLNQTNFGLCFADLILAIISLGISFWYNLPYDSIIANIVYLIFIIYFIIYDSISLYYYSNNNIIDNIFLNMCLAQIVLYSVMIFFECIRGCLGINHIWDKYLDDRYSTQSSAFYNIRDIFSYFGCNCKCTHFCEPIENCCLSYNKKFKDGFKEKTDERKHKIKKSTSQQIPIAEPVFKEIALV